MYCTAQGTVGNIGNFWLIATSRFYIKGQLDFDSVQTQLSKGHIIEPKKVDIFFYFGAIFGEFSNFCAKFFTHFFNFRA